jgi:predicted DNA-binding transcriptional regulator AlpA/ribosomal protein L24E
MSSNIQIKRVCEHCGKPFLARTTVTRFCSHKCNSRFYKLQQKQKKIESSNTVTRNTILQQEPAADNATTILSKELLNVKELSVITGVSERTLFRLIKDDGFPRMRLGRRLVFNKASVIDYFTTKYGQQ